MSQTTTDSVTIKPACEQKDSPEDQLLKATLDAMLDCLTEEQQAKVTSFLLREPRPSEPKDAPAKTGN